MKRNAKSLAFEESMPAFLSRDQRSINSPYLLVIEVKYENPPRDSQRLFLEEE